VGDISAIVRVQDAIGSVSTTSLTVSVIQATQSGLIFSSPPSTPLYPDGASHTFVVTGGNGTGAVSVSIAQSSDGVCSLTENSDNFSLTFISAGTCTVNYQKAGDTNYFETGMESYDIVISPREGQTTQLSFSSLPSQIAAGSFHDITVTGGNGSGTINVDVASWSTSNCSVTSINTSPVQSVATVKMTSLGFCTITAKRLGSYGWDESSEQNISFQIYGTRDITLDPQSFQRIYFYSGSNLSETLAATVTEGMPYSVGFSTTSDSSICTINRYDLEITGTGICTIQAIEGDASYKSSTSPAESLYIVAAGDTAPPTISSVTATAVSGRYLTGETIDIDVQFSERVIVTGTPRLRLNTNSNSGFGTYLSGNFEDTIRFRYVVTQEDASEVFDYVSSESFQLNGGTVSDLSSNSAQIALPLPGTPNSISGQNSIHIGVAPQVPHVPEVPELTVPNATESITPPITPTQPAVAVVTPPASSGTTAQETFTLLSAKPIITLKRGKKMTKATLLKRFNYRAPRGSTVTVTRQNASKRSCSIVRSSLVALRIGSCRITITMKPKKGKTQRTQHLLTIN
jgi:hypothetical protein